MKPLFAPFSQARQCDLWRLTSAKATKSMSPWPSFWRTPRSLPRVESPNLPRKFTCKVSWDHSGASLPRKWRYQSSMYYSFWQVLIVWNYLFKMFFVLYHWYSNNYMYYWTIYSIVVPNTYIRYIQLLSLSSVMELLKACLNYD